MGEVKKLLEARVDEVIESYYNDDIDFKEAFNRLCQLGYGPDYARDTLDAVKQLELFSNDN